MPPYITVAELDRRRANGEKINTNLILRKDLTKQQKKIISQAMSTLGKQGKGQSKVRGDSEYYKKLTAIRESKRKLKTNSPLSNASPS